MQKVICTRKIWFAVLFTSSQPTTLVKSLVTGQQQQQQQRGCDSSSYQTPYHRLTYAILIWLLQCGQRLYRPDEGSEMRLYSCLVLTLAVRHLPNYARELERACYAVKL